jgi:hypothetical protein
MRQVVERMKRYLRTDKLDFLMALSVEPMAARLGLTSRRSLEQVEEDDGVETERNRYGHGEPRQVPLDDVRPALGVRREAEPAHAGLAARVHEYERHHPRRDEHLEDRRDRKHRGARVAAG